MKNVFLVAVTCCWCLLSILACKPTGSGSGVVEVDIKGGGEFPKALVGTWEAEDSDMDVVFEPNGSVSSAFIGLGLRMTPGRPTVMPEGKGTYEPGKWIVSYTPDGNRLTVEITVDRFKAQMGENSISGSIRYYYDGPVFLEAGIWNAEVIQFPRYVANTTEYHNYELPVDQNNVITQTVVFRKVPGKQGTN